MTRLEKENEILKRRLASDEQPYPSEIPQDGGEDDGTAHIQLAERSLVKQLIICCCCCYCLLLTVHKLKNLKKS